ncbi:MAG: hypothetical protein EOP86_03875 [Verrucomicrobiaceae bacterium]|nr:MAG: hypothetical protein EOP86_03875 [Verrucomicrobiaceae bacterium]
MNGYIVACADHSIGACHGIPEDFHEWAAYRTRSRESTRGWCQLITDATGSDEAAFDRFFELLDEHAYRRPSVFARLRGCKAQYSFWTDCGELRAFRYPTSIALVIHSDDPGFRPLFPNKDESGGGRGPERRRGPLVFPAAPSGISRMRFFVG